MNSKYLQEFLGYKIGPPMGERSKERELNTPYNLEKWKTSVFKCLTKRPNLERRLDVIL